MLVRVVELDDNLNETGRLLGNVASLSVSKSCTDDVSLLEAATIEFDQPSSVFAGGWHRIDTVEGGKLEHRGVFLFSKDSAVNHPNYSTVTASGKSVLYQSSVDTVDAGLSVSAGQDGAAFVRSMLRCNPGRIVCEPFRIAKNDSFDGECTKLESAWRVIDAAGYVIQLDGDGTARIVAKDSTKLHRISSRSKVYQDIDEKDGEVSYTFNGSIEPFDRVEIGLATGLSRRGYVCTEADVDYTTAGIETAVKAAELDRSALWIKS